MTVISFIKDFLGVLLGLFVAIAITGIWGWCMITLYHMAVASGPIMVFIFFFWFFGGFAKK